MPSLRIVSHVAPVPGRLVAKIVAGSFVDMSELLPAALARDLASTYLHPLVSSASSDNTRLNKPQIRNLQDWIESWASYTAVLSHFFLACVPDLLGYMLLISQADKDYGALCWLAYDRAFHCQAAISGNSDWSRRDPDLWSFAFSSLSASRCATCLESSHTTDQCPFHPTGIVEVSSLSEATGNPAGSLPCILFNLGWCSARFSPCKFLQHMWTFAPDVSCLLLQFE